MARSRGQWYSLSSTERINTVAPRVTHRTIQALVDFCLQQVAVELRGDDGKLWVKRSHIQNMLGQPEGQSVAHLGKRPKPLMEYLVASKSEWDPDQEDSAVPGYVSVKYGGLIYDERSREPD